MSYPDLWSHDAEDQKPREVEQSVKERDYFTKVKLNEHASDQSGSRWSGEDYSGREWGGGRTR
jgi:hypothetical protein